MEKAIMAWSGGKDSAMALYEIRKQREYDVVALLTTITEDYGRISMHGVRESLLEEQAASIGLPLEKVLIRKDCDNAKYEEAMAEVLTRYAATGVTSVIFGDIFLEDLRIYRENKLASVGLKGVFPLWKRDTAKLARDFIRSGFRSVLTCVDSKALDGSFAGRVFDEELLNSLPANVDPCGENGEFHSFAFDGPIFGKKIEFKTGETILRDNRFYYCDLISGRQRCFQKS
ncbi:MAG: diphthine--ammonia ligase [Candidatus Omnitrophica bacterium]|nr:diphthine--ammonia ligase [Candidatus Omnitrophota bacterium]